MQAVHALLHGALDVGELVDIEDNRLDPRARLRATCGDALYDRQHARGCHAFRLLLSVCAEAIGGAQSALL